MALPIFFRTTQISLVSHFWLTFIFGCLAISNVQAATLQLDQADFVMSSSDTPPNNLTTWAPQKLPDLWSISRPGVGGNGWYRLRFSLRDIPSETQAVYLPRLCMNAAVYLNDVLLGDGGQFSEPVARNWNRPLLFLIPPKLLLLGENNLLIRVYSPAYSLGSLSTIYVGSERDLRPEYEDKFFWRITLNQASTLIIAAMGLFMLALWHRRRQDTMYGYFGLSAFVWAFNSSNLFIQSSPISARLWETLISASFQMFISLLMISLLRILGLRQIRLEQTLWLILIGSPLTLLLIPDNWLIAVSMMWHLATLFSSLAVVGYLLRAVRQNPQPDALLLIGALCVSIVFGIHDWLKQASIMQSGDTHWVHFAAPIFFLVVGGIMTNRFVLALNQVEQLNTDLEQRVQAKHAELETQFSNMQIIEKERATLAERNRIYRDLHDDVGAKLLGLAISAQRANLPKEADLARSALQDLRDVVSRSAHDITPLDDLLADLRAETEQRVQGAGLALDWQFPKHETALIVSPEAALNVSRILREAVSNALRHAQARRIKIIIRVDLENFYLIIEDDGIGLATESLKPHRGMSSMQARASALKATIDWRPVPPHGCQVKLCAPLTVLTP